jgi:hypothetical protein
LAKPWSDLSWQEKREERFKRWLSPIDVNFISPAAEKLYRQRVTRFIQAVKLEEPDRVPVALPEGTFPAYYAGYDLQTVMYDYTALRRAWIKFMDDFGDMDQFSFPVVPAGRLGEAINSKIFLFPGHGLPVNSTMTQSVEGEYMRADEYDWIMRDPSDYQFRVNLPRTAGIFASFKKLPPLHQLQGEAWISLLADPEIRLTFQTLIDLAGEHQIYASAVQEINDAALSRGYPAFFNYYSGLLPMAPFDHFADLLRGTRGIAGDMYRQPEKLLQAIDRQTALVLDTIENFPLTRCPMVFIPLHKGDDTFMSDKQFATFYWPSLRKVLLALIEEGLVPLPFAEGRYTRRLRQIADTPKSGVVWLFDQTDMAEAKKVLGNVSCICGNVPTSLIKTGSPQQVKACCRQLIETCAPGGGFVLAGGAAIDNGNMANLKAMMESAYEYGVYRR